MINVPITLKDLDHQASRARNTIAIGDLSNGEFFLTGMGTHLPYQLIDKNYSSAIVFDWNYREIVVFEFSKKVIPLCIETNFWIRK